MKKLLFILAGLLMMGCNRLDSFMFEPDRSITEYKLDDYDGEVDFTLSSAYDIPDSLVHLFQLKAEDNSTIYAVYIGDTNTIATDTVIKYCHGNWAHMDFYWPRAKLLANTGGKNRFGVLMVEYRGYGLSEGEATEEHLTEDVNTALKWLQSKGLTNDRLAIYGFSLGTAPATDISANGGQLTPSWLILEAPFASTEVLVQDAAALSIPASFFTNGEYDNAEEIKKVGQPFLWIHGTEDAKLSMKTHGEVVYKNYGGTDGTAVRVEGAGHSNVPRVMGFTGYLDTLNNFIIK